MSDNIFNERGLLRDDLENVRVSPERQPVLDALVRAVGGAEAAEEDVRHIESIVAEAVKHRDRVVASMPRSTPLDEVRRMAAHDEDMRRLRHGLAPISRKVDGVRGDPPPSQAAPVHPQALRLADAALELARSELRESRDALARARETVSRALASYNRLTPAMTAEQNTRSWIASNNAARAERAAARYVPTLTETARAMGGGVGPGPQLVRDQTPHGQIVGGTARAGGGAAYRRGPGGVQAYTKAQAATITAHRIREARAKLPSER